MGVNLTPIIEKKIISLEDIRGKSFAVDAYVVLHQFLALIRTGDGKPLMNKEGDVTSHLVGLALRTTHLISEFNMDFIFVFDGKPLKLKENEILRRKKLREKAKQDYQKALLKKDYKTAFSKAVMTGQLTTQNVEDAKKLLDLLGIKWIQAPSEGEAQAAYMTKKGIVWACNSQDYDSLLYGATRLVRYITIQGKEWLPSKLKTRKLRPEIIDLTSFLKKLEIKYEQLIDLSILIGTDYNLGVKGIDPKKSLKLIKKYGQIENLPNEIKGKLPLNIDEIRNIYLKPKIIHDYNFNKEELKEEELISFLCDKHSFNRKTVNIIINRMKKSRSRKKITQWLG
ncbi:flap endonuclease-1 [Candidatus Bathyarchaeota archaeon]|nr:flap endonuclease-1 [Candidatus Bathyarchaeota archaeon]